MTLRTTEEKIQLAFSLTEEEIDTEVCVPLAIFKHWLCGEITLFGVTIFL
jgi:hypothetical protein